MDITAVDEDSMSIAKELYSGSQSKNLKIKQATKNVNVGISPVVFVFLFH